jgi:uncharacterized protein (DUF927 family)
MWFRVTSKRLVPAFAAAVLDVVGVDSFTIDISGRSICGKTTAAKIRTARH